MSPTRFRFSALLTVRVKVEVLFNVSLFFQGAHNLELY